jgi:hypothetical protein
VGIFSLSWNILSKVRLTKAPHGAAVVVGVRAVEQAARCHMKMVLLARRRPAPAARTRTPQLACM